MIQPETAHYVFVTSNRATHDVEIPAIRTIRDLLKSGYWVLGSRSRYRKRIKSGDKAIFYAAGQGNSNFIATAIIKSTCDPISARQKKEIDKVNKELLDELSLDYPDLHCFKINSAKFFEKPVRAKEILDRLSFIKNRNRWGTHFQAGAIRIPKEDFRLIMDMGNSFYVEQENDN